MTRDPLAPVVPGGWRRGLERLGLWLLEVARRRNLTAIEVADALSTRQPIDITCDIDTGLVTVLAGGRWIRIQS